MTASPPGPLSTPWGGGDSRWGWAALVLVLALAAILRMGAPGITEFKRDEGNLSQLALDLVHGREWPLLGLSSSVNVPNPPISVYLMAIPFFFSDSPIFATMFVGLLNVIAVGLVWGLARRYYGPRAALIAGLLYAVSPWAVLYSRKIWAQDLLPPFVIAVIFTGLLGYGEGRRWARWAHWPLLALAVQIHYAAFTLIPISLLMLLLWPQADPAARPVDRAGCRGADRDPGADRRVSGRLAVAGHPARAVGVQPGTRARDQHDGT